MTGLTRDRESVSRSDTSVSDSTRPPVTVNPRLKGAAAMSRHKPPSAPGKPPGGGDGAGKDPPDHRDRDSYFDPPRVRRSRATGQYLPPFHNDPDPVLPFPDRD